jgi:hypothetical protein
MYPMNAQMCAPEGRYRVQEFSSSVKTLLNKSAVEELFSGRKWRQAEQFFQFGSLEAGLYQIR